MVQRGVPHFFSKIGDNMVWRGDTLLKNFLAILGISGEKGVPDWSPRESKPADKTVHHPSGVISEVLPRANLGPGHARSTKLTLGRTSEMTPEGWCTVFSAGLDSLGGQYGTPFPPEITKIAKKCPQRW